MKTYTGTKTVNATPMTRLAYNQFRGWTLPADENGDDEGYLVEYTDGGKPNTTQYAGYVSWSPKEQFDNAYRESATITRSRLCGVDCHTGEAACNGYCTGRCNSPARYKIQLHDFGGAMRAMKEGKKVSRVGWNGQGMFAYMVPANQYPAQTGAAKSHFGDRMVPYNAYLALKTANGTVSTWAPSGSDALAEDWEILP